MNESTLLINSPFSLTQKNNVPIYTQLGETIIRPFNDDEIRDQLQKQMSPTDIVGVNDQGL